MVEHAFLIVPLDAFEPDADWASLSKVGRLARMRRRLEGLTAAIAERLHGMEVEEGVGSWTVRSSEPASRDDIIRLLEGLPVAVAPDARFHTM